MDLSSISVMTEITALTGAAVKRGGLSHLGTVKLSGPYNGLLNITVLKDEFRVGTVGRVASYVLAGRKIRCRSTPAAESACDIDRLER
jgi:hypothetical protein